MKSTLKNMTLSLGGISAVAALALSLCYNATLEPRRQAAAEAADKAIEAVLPPFDNSPAQQAAEVDGCTVYPAVKDGKIVGAAVETVTPDGFSGDILIIVGFAAGGTLTDYVVLSQSETPGLGAKAAEWFRDPSGHRSVIGTTAELSLTKDGGSVDGITAATITSRAFVGAVNHARQVFLKYMSQQ